MLKRLKYWFIRNYYVTFHTYRCLNIIFNGFYPTYGAIINTQVEHITSYNLKYLGNNWYLMLDRND